MDIKPTHQGEGNDGEVRKLTQEEIENHLQSMRSKSTTPISEEAKVAENDESRKRAVTEAIRLAKESKSLSERLEAAEAEKSRLAEENKTREAELQFLKIEKQVTDNPALLLQVEAQDPQIGALLRQRNPQLNARGDDARVRSIVEETIIKHKTSEAAAIAEKARKDAEEYLIEMAMQNGMSEKDESFKKVIALFSRIENPSKQDVDMLFSANSGQNVSLPLAMNRSSARSTNQQPKRVSSAYQQLERELGLK